MSFWPIESFILSHRLKTCPKCNKTKWVHFDVSGVCHDCSLKLFHMPNTESEVTDFVYLRKATDAEYVSALEIVVKNFRESLAKEG